LEDFLKEGHLAELSRKYALFCASENVVVDFIELIELLNDIDAKTTVSGSIPQNLFQTFGVYFNNTRIIELLLDLFITGIDWSYINVEEKLISSSCTHCMRSSKTFTETHLVSIFRYVMLCAERSQLDHHEVEHFLHQVSNKLYKQVTLDPTLQNYLIEFASILAKHEYSFPEQFSDIISNALTIDMIERKSDKIAYILSMFNDTDIIEKIRSQLKPQDLSLLLILSRNSKYIDEARNSYYMHYYPKLQHVRIKNYTNWNNYVLMANAMSKLVNRGLVDPTRDNLEREALSILARQAHDHRVDVMVTQPLLDLLRRLDTTGSIALRAQSILLPCTLTENILENEHIDRVLMVMLKLCKDDLTKHVFQQECNKITSKLEQVRKMFPKDVTKATLIGQIEQLIAFNMFSIKYVQMINKFNDLICLC
jgi:hypothetical protein